MVGLQRVVMINYRDSYSYETHCKFCAEETSLVEEVNTRVCPECYSWIEDSIGLSTLGIHAVA
jgi:hypothetical protein